MKRILCFVLHQYVQQILKPNERVKHCASFHIPPYRKHQMLFITTQRVIRVRKLSLLYCQLDTWPLENLVRRSIPQ